MPDIDAGRVHDFGPFHYDAERHVLLRGDTPIPLEPKVSDTLEALLARRGQVVEKADLMKRVWPDCVVEDTGLTRNISLLRKALDDDAGTYIETVPKRGYRFAPPAPPPKLPQPKLPPPAPHRTMWLVVMACVIGCAAFIYWQFYQASRYLPASGSAANVAVIPIECLGDELRQTVFSQGISNSLVAALSQLPNVRMVSPSTVQRYRRFGIPTPIMTRILGVQVVVEGTAQKFGERLRVSLRMTDVHSGKLIWADDFDVPASDPLQAEASVAREAAGMIGRRLGPTH